MRVTRTWLAVAAVGCAAVSGAFVAGRLWAAGIPDSAPGLLTYSGTIEDVNGAPLTGSKNLQVLFWDSATLTPGIVPLCQTSSVGAVILVAGRFSLALDKACADAVKVNQNIWAQVVVDDTPLPRTKLGAVPYAMEAGHAMAADIASSAVGAGGALQTTLSGLQSDLNALKSTALTSIFGTTITSSEPSTDSWSVQARNCVSAVTANSTVLVDCSIAANRKCLGLGYNMGVFVGEANSTTERSIVCIK